MYTFTPQQMMGGASFQSSVRIGNWNEDIEYKQAKYNEYLKKKESGQLPSHKRKKKIHHHNYPVSLTPVSENGFLCFGSKVMLYNEQTKGFLGVDLDDRLHEIIERFGVTTAPQPHPVSRSCFVIEKASTKENDLFEVNGEEEFVHYGQHVKLRLCDEIYEKPLYLRSEKISPTQFSKKTHHQEASVDDVDNYYAVWKMEFLDPKYRFELDGERIKANTPVLICHCHTNELLFSCNNATVYNDFGKEYEVSVKRSLGTHRIENPHNYWSIVVAGKKKEGNEKDENDRETTEK